MFNSLDVLDDLVPVSELSNGRISAVLSKSDRAPSSSSSATSRPMC